MSKLSQELMDELFFRRETEDPSVVLGPRFGEDAAVLDIGDTKLVIHTDPISGAVVDIGWLALNIAANDIAVTGAPPRWALCSIQMPEGMGDAVIKQISEDLRVAAADLDVTIVGGHTETVSGIDRPLLSTTMMGLTDEPVYTSGSEEGDKILQIKPAAIEGCWILVNDHRDELLKLGVDEKTLDEIAGWRNDISVVKPALEIRHKATSLHDPTEGGVFQGLYEMARCSGNDFFIDSEIYIREETEAICEVLDIDPLYFISSGCLLATVPRGADHDKGRVIGQVREGEGRVFYNGREVKERPEDELFRILKELEK